jgi:hypothetical protein
VCDRPVFFDIREYESYADEPTPAEIGKLLSRIMQSAHDLSFAICRLRTLSNRLRDPTAPLRRAHIGWLDALISQAAAGLPLTNVDESGEFLVHVDAMKNDFLNLLAQVETATQTAHNRLDRKLLGRERGQANPAIQSFVFRCGEIWKSLTGRTPSANKVHRKGDSIHDENGNDPDFVIFVRELAKIGPAPEPSRHQVASSLRKIRPRN